MAFYLKNGSPFMYDENGDIRGVRDPDNNSETEFLTTQEVGETRSLISTGGAPVKLTGTSELGGTLTASLSSGWSATGYQWYRDGAAISGATAQTYTLVSADVGTVVTCAVSGLVYVLTGETVTGTVVAAKTFVLMLDSLTQGSASATSYVNAVISTLGASNVKAVIHDVAPSGARDYTGPYITTTLTDSGIYPISGSAYTNAIRQRSFEGHGAYTLATASGAAIVMTSTRAWTSAEVFYLVDPTGLSSSFAGSFVARCGTSTLPASAVTCSGTDSTTLQAFGDGTYLAKKTVAVDNTNGTPLVLKLDTWTGRACVFCVRFNFREDGITLYNAGIAGLATYQVSGLLATAQQAWVQALGLTHCVINTGMNDRTNSSYNTAATFQPLLDTVLQNYITAGMSGSNIYILEPLQSSDAGTDVYRTAYQAEATAIGGTYIDQRAWAATSVLGLASGSRATYTQMNAAGYMLDALHPNTAYNALLGAYLAGTYIKP